MAFDGAAGVVGQQCGGHLAAPGVVHADEQDFGNRSCGGHGGSLVSGYCREPLVGVAGGEHGQVGGDAGGQRQLGEHVHDHGLDRLGAEDAVESAGQLVDGLVKPGVWAGEREVFEVATARRAPSRDSDDDRRGVG